MPAHGGDGSDADTITALLTGEERLELEVCGRVCIQSRHARSVPAHMICRGFFFFFFCDTSRSVRERSKKCRIKC